MNDIKTQYEMLKQSAANGESNGANEAHRCGGWYTSCDPGNDVAYIQTGAGAWCSDHTSAPVLLPPESTAPHRAHPFPPSAVTKGITHYTLQAKSCANRDAQRPYWMTQRKGDKSPLGETLLPLMLTTIHGGIDTTLNLAVENHIEPSVVIYKSFAFNTLLE